MTDSYSFKPYRWWLAVAQSRRRKYLIVNIYTMYITSIPGPCP